MSLAILVLVALEAVLLWTIYFDHRSESKPESERVTSQIKAAIEIEKRLAAIEAILSGYTERTSRTEKTAPETAWYERR